MNEGIPPPVAGREIITDADLYRAATEYAVDKIKQNGGEILQVASTEGQVPSVWFKGNGVTYYCVVTSARYPRDSEPPRDALSVYKHLKAEGYNGFWFGVSFASEWEVFDPESDKGFPLFVGDRLLPKLTGPVAMEFLAEGTTSQ